MKTFFIIVSFLMMLIGTYAYHKGDKIDAVIMLIWSIKFEQYARDVK